MVTALCCMDTLSRLAAWSTYYQCSGVTPESRQWAKLWHCFELVELTTARMEKLWEVVQCYDHCPHFGEEKPISPLAFWEHFANWELTRALGRKPRAVSWSWDGCGGFWKFLCLAIFASLHLISHCFPLKSNISARNCHTSHVFPPLHHQRRLFHPNRSNSNSTISPECRVRKHILHFPHDLDHPVGKWWHILNGTIIGHVLVKTQISAQSRHIQHQLLYHQVYEFSYTCLQATGLYLYMLNQVPI